MQQSSENGKPLVTCYVQVNLQLFFFKAIYQQSVRLIHSRFELLEKYCTKI